ncbi:hypothetical protein [Streptococcus merionis]|uniref:hypothetical protein n=1 Tax=Streptococcus merionis TaxID=400065 RepID=UPI003517F28C
MIANIRVRDNGNSYVLCQLDLLRFSQEQVRERMAERGIRDDAFFICGFVDWEVDTVMSLAEAYRLKLVLTKFYDGDDFVIKHLLSRHVKLMDVITEYYRFASIDEVELMQLILKDIDSCKIVQLWSQVGSLPNAIAHYIAQGYVLNTERGFYIKI